MLLLVKLTRKPSVCALISALKKTSTALLAGQGADRYRGQGVGGRADRARYGAGRLALSGKAALAGIGVAVHQAVGVAGPIFVAEADLVAELVHHHGEKVDLARGRAAGVGGQLGAGALELAVLARSGVDEPAVAGAVAVDVDDARGGGAEEDSGHVDDAELDGAHRVDLRGARAGVDPALDGGVDHRGEIRLGQDSVGRRGGRSRRGRRRCRRRRRRRRRRCRSSRCRRSIPSRRRRRAWPDRPARPGSAAAR